MLLIKNSDQWQNKRYLLRIINTSLDTGYIFSIDNHTFTVIASDFVSIHNYTTNQLNIAIGRRMRDELCVEQALT
jgi:FtsP/CotA-like multicopper oxidase with cupredoxin domain